MAGTLEYGELVFNLQDVYVMRYDLERRSYTGSVGRIARPQRIEVTPVNDQDDLMSSGSRLHSLSVKTGVQVTMRCAGMDYDAMAIMTGGGLSESGDEDAGERIREYYILPNEDMPYFGIIGTGTTEGGSNMVWVAPAMKLNTGGNVMLDGETNQYSSSDLEGSSAQVEIGLIDRERPLDSINIYETGASFSAPTDSSTFRQLVNVPVPADEHIIETAPTGLDGSSGNVEVFAWCNEVAGIPHRNSAVDSANKYTFSVTQPDLTLGTITISAESLSPRSAAATPAVQVRGLSNTSAFITYTRGTVVARNAAGDSPASAVYNFAPTASTSGIPDEPTGLTVAQGNLGEFNVSWTEHSNTDVRGYLLAWRAQNRGTDLNYGFVDGRSTTSAVLPVIPGDQVHVRLRAVAFMGTNTRHSSLNSPVTVTATAFTTDFAAGNETVMYTWNAPWSMPMQNQQWTFRVVNATFTGSFADTVVEVPDVQVDIQPAGFLRGVPNSSTPNLVAFGSMFWRGGGTVPVTAITTPQTSSANLSVSDSNLPGRPTGLSVAAQDGGGTLSWTNSTTTGGTAIRGTLLAWRRDGIVTPWRYGFTTESSGSVRLRNLRSGVPWLVKIAHINTAVTGGNARPAAIGPFTRPVQFVPL